MFQRVGVWPYIPSLREEILTCVTLCLMFQQRANKKTLCPWGIDPLPCDDDSPNLGQENIVYVVSTLKFFIKPANQNIISRLGPLHSCQTFHISHPGYDLLYCLALGISCHTFFSPILYSKKCFSLLRHLLLQLTCNVYLLLLLLVVAHISSSLSLESCLTRFSIAPDWQVSINTVRRILRIYTPSSSLGPLGTLLVRVTPSLAFAPSSPSQNQQHKRY